MTLNSALVGGVGKQIKGVECSLALARAERATQITNGLVVVLGATCSSASGRDFAVSARVEHLGITLRLLPSTHRS